ncbi:hypothetical protein FHX37_3443 [Haloactinospora alba]|uniref:Uncharacterized protein n=2 Tax=Haloactinospora alba TaxID=405555 RepID=A0A543NNR4_9ACTN|nr:hypothetical protein FHX37_3443 [Haloactinospora alba]
MALSGGMVAAVVSFGAPAANADSIGPYLGWQVPTGEGGCSSPGVIRNLGEEHYSSPKNVTAWMLAEENSDNNNNHIDRTLYRDGVVAAKKSYMCSAGHELVHSYSPTAYQHQTTYQQWNCVAENCHLVFYNDSDWKAGTYK